MTQDDQKYFFEGVAGLCLRAGLLLALHTSTKLVFHSSAVAQRVPQRIFELLSVLQLALERVRALLQQADLAQPRVAVVELREAFGRRV